ncbi:3'-5' exonuclease [Campylobacter sp. RM12327]|nr:3'-5' exonuclease [Campylobacter sputorum]MBE7357422.1 3'-5' exonuclease [Campylobacter sp. RM11302]MBF6668732.1 3'-5' exonuclease [Campylobacter sp. RM12327]MBF6674722.1 3'-5' exonuclease [Campylobacter sp. RM13538]MBF6675961.1 3'-5' exonuclease [Campylobacter sp. RM12321]MBF6677781.1 3'-5' exonuclease [Campylobacter sp. RM11259]
MKLQLEAFIKFFITNPLYYKDFVNIASNIKEINEIINVKNLCEWKTLGLNLQKDYINRVVPVFKHTLIKDQVFCIVDIETNGSMKDGQIIEIGAVKLQNSKIVDTFETLIYAPFIPENITQLTGIFTNDLKDAPNLKIALEKFKIFLQDSVFIAHNVRFDYNFISNSLSKIGLGILLNPKLCTIELAKRTISSKKYGLEHLKELLNINNAHHRAMSDTISATKIFQHCLNFIPDNIKTTYDLINFSKTAPIIPKPEKINTD